MSQLKAIIKTNKGTINVVLHSDKEAKNKNKCILFFILVRKRKASRIYVKNFPTVFILVKNFKKLQRERFKDGSRAPGRGVFFSQANSYLSKNPISKA